MSVTARNRPLWILGASMAFVFMTKAMLAPLVPLYSLSIGASLATVGLLAALSYMLPLLLAMPAGTLVDRHGSRIPIIVGAGMMFLAPALIAVWPGLLAVALTQVISGMAHLIAGVAAQSYLAGLGEGRERERNFGWYTTFVSAGQLVGPLLAGVLVDFLGYQAAFAIAGSVSLIGLLVATTLRPRATLALTSTSFAGDIAMVRALVRTDTVRLGLGVSVSAAFAMSAYQAFLPVYLETLSFSATAIGTFLSLKALVSMLVRPFMPTIVALLGGRSNTLLAMVGLIAAGLAITGFVSTPTLLVLSCTLFGAGFGISQPLSMVSILEDVQATRRGFILGLRLSGNRLAQLISPPILGAAAEQSGFGVAFVIGGFIAVCTSLVASNGSWSKHDAGQ